MRKKLLLADDSITIQKVVELTFPADEFQVVTAGNGRLAVEKAGTFLPDIVLCDVIMPQLDGYQVCEALRGMPELKDVPILLLNGAFEPYDPDRARAAGALGNVSKPFDPPALVAKVKEILAQRPVPAPVVVPVETVPFEPEPEPVPEPELPPAIDASFEPEPLSWGENESEAISTMEVPSDVRELAARSMALDAPVFGSPDPLPEEAAPVETPNLSATLHDSLEVPAGESTFDFEIEAGRPDDDLSVPSEALAEAEPLAANTSEVSLDASFAPEPEAAAELPSLDAFSEEQDGLAPMSFGETPEAPSPSLPQTLPPMAASPFLAPEPDPEPEFAAPTFEPAPVAPAIEDEAPGWIEPMTEPAGFAADAAPAFETSATDPEISAEGEAPVLDPSLSPAAEEAAGSAETPAWSAGAVASEVAVPVDMVQQIAQRVISQVSERVIREIAWDVIPALAEKLIKAEIERIKARAESERD